MDTTIFIAIFLGFTVKLVDLASDKRMKLPSRAESFFAVIYGLIFGLLVHVVPELTEIYLAVAFSILLAHGFKHHAHMIGSAVFIGMLIYWGFPTLNWAYLGIFTLAAFIDEVNNEKGDLRRKSGIFNVIFRWREFLEVGALVMSIYTGVWEIWVGVFLFDSGYALTDSAFGESRARRREYASMLAGRK